MATYNGNDITTLDGKAAGDIITFAYQGKVAPMLLPPGKYKLECWGAQGIYTSASPTGSWNYGRGGYACGTLVLQNEQQVYVYVGGRPYYSKPNSTAYSAGTNDAYQGGWNGGGGKGRGSSYNDNGAGGGATDICLTQSDMAYNNYTYKRTDASYKSRIIVAGGGGGGRSSNANCAGGYNTTNTQSTTSSPGSNGGFGYGGYWGGGSDDYGCGGGGWYGGGTNGDSYGYGGSSFVWSDAHASYVPSGYTPPTTLKMTDISCIKGNTSMPSPQTVGSTVTGNDGNGYARITIIEISAGGAMPYINVGGSWKQPAKVYANIGSTWKEGNMFVKVNGSWTQ